MEAFWCVVLSIIVIRAFIKSERAKKEGNRLPEYKRNTVRNRKALTEAEKQRWRDIEKLRKQGYSDDIITMIIPTINSGQ